MSDRVLWNCGAVVGRLLLHVFLAKYLHSELIQFALGEIIHKTMTGGFMKKISYVVFGNIKNRFTSAKATFHDSCRLAGKKFGLLATFVKNAIRHEEATNTPSHAI